MQEPKSQENDLDFKRLLRNFALELLVYAVLVVAYFFIVLRGLEHILTGLFGENLVLYAVVGLLLILAQGVLMDLITSFLLDQIKLDRFD